MAEHAMRVLLLTNMYPPHHLGGYELSCRDVVERFRARGHHVTVLTSNLTRDDVASTGDDPGVRRRLEFYWRDDELWLPGRKGILAIERKDHSVFREVVREVRPHVISIWNMGALPLSLVEGAISTGLPLVYHVCNDWPALNLQHDGLRAVLRQHPVLGRAIAFAACVPTRLPDVGASGTFCWVSRSTWEGAERATPWRFPDSTVVHTGISHDDFPLLAPPDAPKPWRNRLLYVGRIEGNKSVETIIDALPLLDGMTVDLIGPTEPKYFAGLMELAETRGVADRVKTFELTRPELRARYLDADAFLFTSKTEPFGLVPIEAMACATPVVASGAGGSGEFLVDEQNCLLYPAGDAPALAAAVLRLAREPDTRLRLTREGLATAAEFTVDRLADRLEQAHLEAIKRTVGWPVEARGGPPKAG